MKHHLYSFAAWVNTDPRRVRTLLVMLTLILLLMALILPSSITSAGLAAGGGD